LVAGESLKKLRPEQKAAESIDALKLAETRYAERDDVNSCGDWLALALNHANAPSCAPALLATVA